MGIEKLKTAAKRRTTEVTIGGFTTNICSMSLEERNHIATLDAAVPEDKLIQTLIVYSVCDEFGGTFMTLDQVDEVSTWDSAFVEELADAIMDHNKLMPKDAEALQGNS